MCDNVCESAGKRVSNLRTSKKELQDELRQLRRLVKEAADYLDTNRLTNIAHGSIFHQQFRAASQP